MCSDLFIGLLVYSTETTYTARSPLCCNISAPRRFNWSVSLYLRETQRWSSDMDNEWERGSIYSDTIRGKVIFILNHIDYVQNKHPKETYHHHVNPAVIHNNWLWLNRCVANLCSSAPIHPASLELSWTVMMKVFSTFTQLAYNCFMPAVADLIECVRVQMPQRCLWQTLFCWSCAHVLFSCLH